MKVAIVLFVVLVFSQTQLNIIKAKAIEDTFNDSSTSSFEEAEKFIEYEKACIDELHLKQDIVDLNYKPILPEDNDQFNKFKACYWQKMEFMDNDGNVKYNKLLEAVIEMLEKALARLYPELKSTVINNVKNAVFYCEKNPPKGETIGQTAVKIQNCIMKKLNKLVDDIDGLSSEEDSSDLSSDLSSKEEDCVNELHLYKERIIKLNDRDFVPEDDQDFNNFLACYWMKKEWMEKNGMINYDNLLSSLWEMATIALQGEPHDVKSVMKKRITNAIDYCQGKNIKGRTHGQTAAKLQNCITARVSKGLYE